MNNEVAILCVTAASIAFLHTVLGPDHYIPFLMMSKAGKWSKSKTLWITFFCGLGHVLSSLILGLMGITAGIALEKLRFIEGFRGEIATWGLIAFGFIYMIWGIKHAYQNKPHTHSHVHEDGSIHFHEHSHDGEHVHVHKQSKNLTPWILFTIFVLGPCEPLIPLLMFPAATHSTTSLAAVSIVFAAVTVATMLSVVIITLWGINLVPLSRLQKFTHAFAGFAIFVSGMAINFLKL